MNSLKDRFALLAKEHPEISQADLARATGAKPPSVNAWFSGDTKSMKADTAAKAAALYGCNALWLATGIGSRRSTNGTVDVPQGSAEDALPPEASFQFDNVRPVGNRRPVPLISWVQAGMFAEVQDNFRPGEADTWIVPLYSKPGNRAFALEVEGDSMVNPHPPPALSFPPRTIILVDPDVGFSARSFVIAKDVLTQKATFKQLTTDGGRWYLKPLNPAFPTIEIDDPAIRVIATVTEFQPPGGKLG